jgi:hypothetical protein
MSIKGNRRSTSQERETYAQYLSQTDGGEVADYLKEGQPFYRIWEPVKLEQLGFALKKTYPYTGPNGDLLYQVLRYQHKIVKSEKKFAMRRPTTELISDEWFADGGEIKVPYRWQDLIKHPKEMVIVTEGEDDTDRMYKEGLVATTVAGQHWSDTAADALIGHPIAILEDNDEAGRTNATNSAEWLTGRAGSIKIIRLPGLGYKQDVSDWLDAGHSKAELLAIIAATPAWGMASPLPLLDPTKIPRREWLYYPNYVRKFVSGTVAPGGRSKSSLIVVEALAIASGKALLGIDPRGRHRVWYWNGEDPKEELYRRVAAAMKHYGLTASDIGGRLFVDSGLEVPITIAEQRGQYNVKLNEQTVQRLIDNIKRNQIDAFIIDPWVSCHSVAESNNPGIDRVVKTLGRQIADAMNCAVHIAHHSRKPVPGDPTTTDDSRGASALVDALRMARALNVMSQSEATGASIEANERRRYVRADDGKTNLTRPAEFSTWYKMISVDLENTGPDADWDEKGDNIGVLTSWSYPKSEPPLVSMADITRAQSEIKAGGPWRADQRSKREPWVGLAIAKALCLNLDEGANRRKILKLIEDWLKAGYLRPVAGNERRGVRSEPHTYIEAGRAPEPIGGSSSDPVKVEVPDTSDLPEVPVKPEVAGVETTPANDVGRRSQATPAKKSATGPARSARKTSLRRGSTTPAK